jgi:AmiR/NasT family two-component response regulator
MQNVDLTGKKVLVVEDEPLAAIDHCEQLRLAGAIVVGPVALVSDALACISSHDLDVAVLDHALVDGNSEALQTALEKRRVPYVILTGYPSMLVRRQKGQAILQKPVSTEVLWDALRNACGSR